jgi:surface polysaccharide O-acyltransferase-like enzyme
MTGDGAPVERALPRQHFWYVDALKVGAIAGVAAIHTFGVKAGASTDTGLGQWVADAVFAGSRWSVPIFVMASGALVLESAGRDPGRHYHRRFGRLIPAALFWTAVYLALSARVGGTTDPVQLALLIVSGQPYAHLYFLSAILGLYAIAPLLARALTTRRFVWGAAIGAAAINTIDPLLALVGHGGMAPNLLTWWFPFLGYFLLGYAIHTSRPSTNRGPLAGLFLAAVGVQVGAFVWAHANNPTLRAYFENYSTLPILVAAIALFALARSLDGGGQHDLLRRLAVLCFGVYLSHLLIESLLAGSLHIGADANVLVFTALWAATLGLSFGGTAIAARIPLARRLVGA